MSLKIGSTSIGSLYFGSTKIGQAYLGNVKVYESAVAPVMPYLVFEFTASDFVPTADPSSTHGKKKGGSYAIGYTSRFGSWTQVSSSPNRWKWEGWDYSYIDDMYGIPWAFAFQHDVTGNVVSQLTSANLGGGTCKIIDCGGFDYVDSNNNTFQNMDRCFGPATALTEFVTMQTPSTLVNVNSVFFGATNVAAGALDQYTYWSTYNTNIINHSSTFKDCGANSQTGLQELNQIPTGWGGNMVPVSHTYTATNQTTAGWQMDASGTDVAIPFGSLGGSLNIFTTESVSQYSGVNMRKTTVYNRCNGFSTSAATYYYPMFWQVSGTPYCPTSTTSNVPLSWVRVTSMYNGMLTAAQSSGDMPGTLDYSTYGPMDKEFGTFDSTRVVYFGFLVLNSPIDSSFDWTTTPYGIHSNNFFRNTVINWFVE